MGLEVLGGAIGVRGAFDANSRGDGADGVAAAGAVTVTVARGRASMGSKGANFAGCALRREVALDAEPVVSVAIRRCGVAVGVREATRTRVRHRVAYHGRAVFVGE